MDISYRWLNELIDTGLTVEETAQHLTRVGLAVEGIHVHGGDSVLDIDLTSNRPDCLSHLGIARELCASTGRQLNRAVAAYNEEPAGSFAAIDDPELCPRFTGRIIRGVKIGPSPQWLAARLESLGERSINNVADITNYVMLELGQPMHAFDLDRLSEHRIVVRRARGGEKIRTLDEVERDLDSSMLAICDAEKPVAVAGVMGGLDSSITDSTVNVLLEVAYFDRASIRNTSRRLGLASEASYRFERGVDIENLRRASDRASQLIIELAGGELAEFIDVYPSASPIREVVSNDLSAAVLRLTGLAVSADECVRILALLGIEAQEDKTVFRVPSWRHDLSIEEDLVEEVARHAGYDKIESQLPAAYGAGEYQPTEQRRRRMRQALVDLGFNEAMSYSFIAAKYDDVFETVPGLLDERSAERFVTLQDSVIEGAVRMRPTILPGLLDSVRFNLNHQRRDIRLFEVGGIFASTISEDSLPNEQDSLAIVVTGGDLLENRAVPSRELDFYDAKGGLEAALSAIGIDAEFLPADVRHLRRGQSAIVQFAGVNIGTLGRLSDEIAAMYKFKQPVFVTEINLSAAFGLQVPPIAYRPIARFPSIVRDVSFLTKRDLSVASIGRAVEEENFELCRSVVFVDIYEGKGLAEDERSVTLRFEYRSDERTLIEDEVEQQHARIIALLERKLGIRPRA